MGSVIYNNIILHMAIKRNILNNTDVEDIISIIKNKSIFILSDKKTY